MNVSPHHQRPTKYPWPGSASRIAVLVGLAIIVIIGLLIFDPFSNDDQEPDPAAMPGIAAQQT